MTHVQLASYNSYYVVDVTIASIYYLSVSDNQVTTYF